MFYFYIMYFLFLLSSLLWLVLLFVSALLLCTIIVFNIILLFVQHTTQKYTFNSFGKNRSKQIIMEAKKHILCARTHVGNEILIAKIA